MKASSILKAFYQITIIGFQLSQVNLCKVNLSIQPPVDCYICHLKGVAASEVDCNGFYAMMVPFGDRVYNLM